MKEILDGKRIAIIGNSEHLLKYNLKDVIDAYDIVIRTNKFNVDDFSQHVGSKVDIWATCLFWQVIPFAQDIAKYNIKRTLVTLPLHSKYVEEHEVNRIIKHAKNMGYGETIKNASYVDSSMFDSLCDYIGDNKRPNTGTTCFHWVLNNVDYKEIYLAGFGLGKIKWHYNQKDYGTVGPGFKRHNPLKESELITKYLNDKIKVDPFMEGVIHENIHKHQAQF